MINVALRLSMSDARSGSCIHPPLSRRYLALHLAYLTGTYRKVAGVRACRRLPLDTSQLASFLRD